MKKIFNLIIILTPFIISNLTYSQVYKTYYGLLHAHTLICDGLGTPQEAYTMAKQNGLHFFAITPHNHHKAEDGAKERKDGVLIASNHSLYNGEAEVTVIRKWKENGTDNTETITLKPLLKAASTATDSNFVALYGQEYSTISSGNHVNVIGIEEVITVDNGDYAGLVEFFEELIDEGKQVPVLQLNHSDVQADLFYKGSKESEKKKMFNDYGIDEGDLGPHFKDMILALDPYVHLIEILSGPAMKEEHDYNFKYSSNENDYFFYLKQGFHISPSVGQDNHYKTWGSVTDARMGVLATTLSQTALFDAFKNHRTFASEDKNLSVSYFVNNNVMGSSIQAQEESELNITIKIEDADEPTATYKVIAFRGDILPELSTEATQWKSSDGLVKEFSFTGNGTHSLNNIFASGQPSFIYLKVVQNNIDRLWTAPVWINDNSNSMIAQTVFYWTNSASSKVYHKQDCPSVKSIKAENLRSGTTPPAGRNLHSCIIETEEDH